MLNELKDRAGKVFVEFAGKRLEEELPKAFEYGKEQAGDLLARVGKEFSKLRKTLSSKESKNSSPKEPKNSSPTEPKDSSQKTSRPEQEESSRTPDGLPPTPTHETPPPDGEAESN